MTHKNVRRANQSLKTNFGLGESHTRPITLRDRLRHISKMPLTKDHEANAMPRPTSNNERKKKVSNLSEIDKWRRHCRECDGGNDIKEYFQAFRSETHELMGGTSCDPANTCMTAKNHECREIAGSPPATETDDVNYSDANAGSCAGFDSGGYTLTPIEPTRANLDLFGDIGSIWTLNQ